MQRLFTVFVVVFCAACSMMPSTSISNQALLNAGGLTYQPQLIEVAEADILYLDPAMKQFLDHHLSNVANKNTTLHELLDAVLDKRSFGLEYDTTTRTAAETFAARKGNCLSFTNMFVAMARYAGLNVSFQQVGIPALWRQQGDVFLLNGHINIHVRLNYSTEHVVDFDINDFKSSYEREVVSDQRAAAHYYNNIAAEQLQAGNYDAAYAYFYRGIQNDASFSPLWINLATLYKRVGKYEAASAGYHKAIALQADSLAAYSNLALLESEQGNDQKAQKYRDKVKYYRLRNPYYRLHLAKKMLLAKDYKASLRHVKYALRKVPNDDAFNFVAALTYLKMGDVSAANKYFAKAQEHSETDEQQQLYRHKMDLLTSSL